MAHPALIRITYAYTNAKKKLHFGTLNDIQELSEYFQWCMCAFNCHTGPHKYIYRWRYISLNN